MSQVTQTRRLNYMDVDYDRLSGQYFGWVALLTAIRVFWVIALRTGVFGQPPDPIYETISDLLGAALYILAAVGLVGVISGLYTHSRSEEAVTSTRLLINYVGIVLLVAFAYQANSAIMSQPETAKFSFWGTQLVNGLVLGGVYALVALGYTLVYGILFMINFAHGEVLVMGTFGGWFALMYVLDLGDGTFEVGAASVTLILLPLIFAIMFLPLETLAARAGQRRSDHPAEPDPTWFMTLFSLPIRFFFGALVGYGLLQALGGFAPHVYESLNTIIALLFIVAAGMITSMLTAVSVERIAYRPLRKAPRLTPLDQRDRRVVFLAAGDAERLRSVQKSLYAPQADCGQYRYHHR